MSQITYVKDCIEGARIRVLHENLWRRMQGFAMTLEFKQVISKVIRRSRIRSSVLSAKIQYLAAEMIGGPIR
jgi:hypothetical protein